MYRENIALQRRLDSIKHRGAGISNLGGGGSVASFGLSSVHSRTPLAHGGRRGSRSRAGVSPPRLDSGKAIAYKGSLNFLAKKKEALRIDSENLKMAKRIVSQNSMFPKQRFDQEHEKAERVKAQIQRGGVLQIDTVFKK